MEIIKETEKIESMTILELDTYIDELYNALKDDWVDMVEKFKIQQSLSWVSNIYIKKMEE